MDFADWIGRTTMETDLVSIAAVRGYLSTIADEAASPASGDIAPLLSHWLHFLPGHPMSQVGPDGHPQRGDFIPPVPLPRRMWAGSRVEFLRPLVVGRPITRRSVIKGVTKKSGRSGELVFVTIGHEIADQSGICVREHQDIVYREAISGRENTRESTLAPVDPAWSKVVMPEPVILFRYSALTMNGHRIHYDRPYATNVEGYPGLVVHGPLVATMLLHELSARFPETEVIDFSFKAVKPLFDASPFRVCGSIGGAGEATLFAVDDQGALCVSASATLRQRE